MITQLVIAVALTIGVSALCSILEAMVLSVTTAEIESFKKRSPKRGKILEKYRGKSMKLAPLFSALIQLPIRWELPLQGDWLKKPSAVEAIPS